MTRIVLASSNPGKLAEFNALLADSGLHAEPQSAYDVPDADETGLTFVENALLKARHASRISGLPALADDSGLCVTHLRGAPGSTPRAIAACMATTQRTTRGYCGNWTACQRNSAARSSSAYWCCFSTLMTPRH